VHDPISAPARPPRRFLKPLIALIVVLVAVFIGGRWNLNEYAITPGQATPIAPLVKVQGVKTDPHNDKIMLVDVYLSTVDVFQWIGLHFESHVQYVPADELIEPGVPSNELGPQGYQEMNDSKQAAEVAAFRALGWKVPATPTGTAITGVVAPSPANSANLQVGDEIVGVDGHTVTSNCGLVALVHSRSVGTHLRLSIRKAKISPSGTITLKSPTTVELTTAKGPSYLGATGCAGVTGPNRSWIGVTIEDGTNYALPATVSINTADIGGPSAGLAMTLDLIDKLSRGSLTGHHVIAVTGTIAVNGSVGDVGGVAEKTVAASRAGATIFFVPQVEVATAKSIGEPGLRIVGVTSLKQVLSDLRQLGGAAPIPLTQPH
jgi:PDZ domain-containing protein